MDCQSGGAGCSDRWGKKACDPEPGRLLQSLDFIAKSRLVEYNMRNSFTVLRHNTAAQLHEVPSHKS